MKVIKFAPGLIPVLKHEQHDQSTHGNWADGQVPTSVGSYTLDPSSDPMGLTVYNHPNGSRVIFQGIDNYYDGDGNPTPEKKEKIAEALEIIDSLQTKYPLENLTIAFENDPDGENVVVYPDMGQAINIQRSAMNREQLEGTARPAGLLSKDLPNGKRAGSYIVINSQILGNDPNGVPFTYKTFTEANGGTANPNHLVGNDLPVMLATITHEYGHALDFRSESDARFAWVNMDDSSTSEYGKTNSREYFAETFTAWQLDRNNPKWEKSFTLLDMGNVGKKVDKSVGSGILFIVKDRFDGGEPFLQEFGEVQKHQEHDQSTHGSWATGQTGDASTRELLLQQASQYETFEEFSNAVSLQGLRPRAWHIADTGFELDPNFKPMSRTGGTSDEPGLFVGDPETWQDYAVGRSTVIEYDVSNLSFTAKPLADTSADFFPDQSGNQGFFIRPSAFSRLREVRRMPIEEALSRAKQQQDAMPKSKAEAKQIWEESRSVKKHQEHDQSSHGNWADGSQGSSSELSDDEIKDIIYNSATVNEMFQKVAERLGKSMKPKVSDLSEEEINFFRGVTDVNRDAQRLVDGRIPFTPFQTWGQGIYISSEPEYAQAYGDLIRLKLDDSVKLVEGEIEWMKAFERDIDSSIDKPRLLERITAGKMDNLSDSDMQNIYWAAKGYDGYSVYRYGRAEVVLFNADKLTVNRADMGEAVQKHQQHDQSSHGNWADGSSESGLDAMPYEWKPEFKERERLTARELSSEELNLGRSQLQQVAEAPIAIRVSSGDLELRKIVENGGFKSLTELPEPTLGFEIEYNEGRYDLEKGLWGQPTNANSPIYGYFDTPLQPSVDNETLSYGDVKIILKDKVAGRTTISPGDSANHGLTPVLVTDARKGNLSLEQVDSAYRSRHFQRGMTTVSRPIYSVRTARDIDYFEAQIHGGVSLSDIKSVRLGKYSIVGDSTIALLEKAGIEVIRDDK